MAFYVLLDHSQAPIARAHPTPTPTPTPHPASPREWPDEEGAIAIPIRVPHSPKPAPAPAPAPDTATSSPSDPSSDPSPSSSSSSSGVVLPSSYRAPMLLGSYVFPLVATISVASASGRSEVFLAPAVLVITVVIGLCVWVGRLSVFAFGVNASGVPVMSRTQLTQLIIARFTVGFWVLGSLMSLVIGLESVIVAAVPGPIDQSDQYFIISMVCYLMLGYQFWLAVYFATIKRDGTGTNLGHVKVVRISTMALTMGCTTAQLWLAFAVLAYRVDWLEAVAGTDIPPQANLSSVKVMVVALLIAVTLLPVDACGAGHLVTHIRLRVFFRDRLSVLRGGEDAVVRNPALRTSLDHYGIFYPLMFRGTLMFTLVLCFQLIVSGTVTYAGVLIYLAVVGAMAIPFAVYSARVRARLEACMNLPPAVPIPTPQQHEPLVRVVWNI